MAVSFLLLESGDRLLLESGDLLVLEGATEADGPVVFRTGRPAPILETGVPAVTFTAGPPAGTTGEI